jgi:hypothetical protein
MLGLPTAVFVRRVVKKVGDEHIKVVRAGKYQHRKM